MSSQLSPYLLFATVPKLAEVDAMEKAFARSKNYWNHCDVHLVDQALSKELPDGIGASADAYVLTVGSVTSEC